MQMELARGHYLQKEKIPALSSTKIIKVNYIECFNLYVKLLINVLMLKQQKFESCF